MIILINIHEMAEITWNYLTLLDTDVNTKTDETDDSRIINDVFIGVSDDTVKSDDDIVVESDIIICDDVVKSNEDTVRFDDRDNNIEPIWDFYVLSSAIAGCFDKTTDVCIENDNESKGVVVKNEMPKNYAENADHVRSKLTRLLISNKWFDSIGIYEWEVELKFESESECQIEFVLFMVQTGEIIQNLASMILTRWKRNFWSLDPADINRWTIDYWPNKSLKVNEIDNGYEHKNVTSQCIDRDRSHSTIDVAVVLDTFNRSVKYKLNGIDVMEKRMLTSIDELNVFQPAINTYDISHVKLIRYKHVSLNIDK